MFVWWRCKSGGGVWCVLEWRLLSVTPVSSIDVAVASRRQCGASLWWRVCDDGDGMWRSVQISLTFLIADRFADLWRCVRSVVLVCGHDGDGDGDGDDLGRLRWLWTVTVTPNYGVGVL
ncbi:Hypothetical predicted protein [Olea europaea subsp. europaea]|uniref:Secreted protein n=1 Tax=Olea europaea subsp. europaea TaxID=158383 RepID=A0A8S0QXZ7_OLEEU|nr:Hypothetical predicted protein [Olea europaea subsp. europaea]